MSTSTDNTADPFAPTSTELDFIRTKIMDELIPDAITEIKLTGKYSGDIYVMLRMPPDPMIRFKDLPKHIVHYFLQTDATKKELKGYIHTVLHDFKKVGWFPLGVLMLSDAYISKQKKDTVDLNEGKYIKPSEDPNRVECILGMLSIKHKMGLVGWPYTRDAVGMVTLADQPEYTLLETLNDIKPDDHSKFNALMPTDL